MSDILSMLVQRERGLAAALEPRLPSRFESDTASASPVDDIPRPAGVAAADAASAVPAAAPTSPRREATTAAPVAAAARPAMVAPERAAAPTMTIVRETNKTNTPPRERAVLVQPAPPPATPVHQPIAYTPAPETLVRTVHSTAVGAAPVQAAETPRGIAGDGVSRISAAAPLSAPELAPVRVTLNVTAASSGARAAIRDNLVPAAALPTAQPQPTRRDAAPAAPAPVVHISIGKVEVRALAAAPKPARAARDPVPASLDDYLNRRNGRERQ